MKFGRIEEIKSAIDYGINLPTKNTLLFYASNYNQKEIVKLLLEANADVNAKTTNEGHYYSPLKVAKEKNYEQIIQLLKEYGAKE